MQALHCQGPSWITDTLRSGQYPQRQDASFLLFLLYKGRAIVPTELQRLEALILYGSGFTSGP